MVDFGQGGSQEEVKVPLVELRRAVWAEARRLEDGESPPTSSAPSFVSTRSVGCRNTIPYAASTKPNRKVAY